MSQSIETFSEYSSELRSVYGHNDENRDLSGMWMRLVHRASELGEEVRESKEEAKDYENILEPLADLFCWLNNFINRCNSHSNAVFHLDTYYPSSVEVGGEPSWIIWEKYPGFCSTCFNNPDMDRVKMKRSVDQDFYRCACSFGTDPRTQWDLIKKEDKPDNVEKRAHEIARNYIESRPTKVDEMLEMFRHIYGDRYQNYTLQLITFHFLEEVGEVTEELAKLQSLNPAPSEDANLDRADINNEILEDIDEITWELRKELADVYSWIAAVVIQLDNIRNKVNSLDQVIAPTTDNSEPIKLTTIIDSRFRNDAGEFVCPTCGEQRCDPSQHGIYW